ncbi:MAG TPA: methylenetetrahydrofolate reductase [Chloroflexota bacterium]|nr:methylenetetrahydrofolate reductase [Chloroflexota bacterium]
MKTDSALEARLSAGEFAVTAEIGPPKSADGEVVRRKAAALAGLVDAANITDNQTAVVRLSSIAGALIAREAGVEPIVQVTCRDRNRIAIQSDLLGAYALGVRNVLCMTGDAAKAGNHPDAKDVFDLTTADLLAMLRGMRDANKFLNGEDMRVAPRCFIGATSAPMLGPMDKELARLEERVNLGADFFQSQFVYDVAAFRPFIEQWVDRGLAERAFFLAGVGPLKSLAQAQHMNGLPGVVIPPAVLKRLADAADQQQEGVAICLEVIQQLRELPGVAGVHVMAVAQEDVVPDLIRAAKLR